MKVLEVKESDIDLYGDWLQPEKALEFANGGYTNITCDGVTSQCELSFDDEGAPMVLLGLDVQDA